MYTYGELAPLHRTAFQGFTYPAFRPLLTDASVASRCLAIGAWCGWQPIGLALASLPSGQSAEVLSVCVLAAYRRQGVATTLFQQLEERLYQRGCGVAQVTYTSGTPSTVAVERLLARCAWEPPRVRTLICKAGKPLPLPPWLHRYRLPSGYQVFPWAAITPPERDMLTKQHAHIPSGLYPFAWEHALEPLNSLGLRYHGQVIGWLLTHRLAPDTVRYTCGYVLPECQRRGALLGLIREALRRQVEVLGVESRIIWATPVRYAAMVAFIRRRLTPYLDSLTESRASSKLLGPGHTGLSPDSGAGQALTAAAI